MITHPPSDRAVFGLGTNSLSLPIGLSILSTMEQLAAGRTPLTRSSERSPQVPGSERARPARFPGYLLPSCPGQPDRGIPFNVMSRTIGIARGAAGPGELPGTALAPASASVYLTKDSAGGKPGKPCTNAEATKACDERENNEFSLSDSPMACRSKYAKEVIVAILSHSPSRRPGWWELQLNLQLK